MEEMEAALKAAKIGGEILAKHFENPTVHGKGYHDIVTDADVECELALKDFFAQNFPDYGFIGEETEDNPVEGKNWVVDPLDGTREFAFGIPYFSVSIALVEGKKILLGVVHNPAMGDYYRAELGKGAFKNGKPLAIGKEKNLKNALATGSFVHSRPEMARIAYGTKIFVLNYSPALDLCAVASGRTDATAFTFSNVEDHGAGALMVTEAGGVVSNFGTPGFDPFGDGIIAANAALHGQLHKLFPKPFEQITFEERQYKEQRF